ncbi:hypothetical protein L6270_01235 [Candidatus Parcubacteria bacterium]|nr:hypothetical protein [Patescibacteria group bacterium]MBU4309766.1 hypothetical protein [Patescibacteria group bacterium]MBU4431772.1 hypothetical protein [Patescibacteria group bacterium]MBU4578105.1 hypothetical protein [Patescibacteria group bacterium]MCG2696642.1 hypothetical protein [Candidatus Parcubacteria bacterium]
MENNEKKEEVISWHVPEYIAYERSQNWYIIAGLVALGFLVFSFLTHDFLFAVIVIIAVLLYVLNHGQEPMMINITLTDEGVIVGRKFYDYDELKNFSVLYKPKQEVRNLYFEFKSGIKHRISVQLDGMDPIAIREYLLRYLHEDLERTDLPLSEGLARLLKL